VELSRIFIAMEVSLLASHLTQPCEGHLDAVMHMFAHLKRRHNSHLAFDPSYPYIDLADETIHYSVD
jgi:hypothetical protein